MKIHYEVFGSGEPAILLLPTWTIGHARQCVIRRTSSATGRVTLTRKAISISAKNRTCVPRNTDLQ